jgi:pimeloyl-ACP methyl ester carboxylesterase
LVSSDPMLIDVEEKLAQQPPICVPSITVDGDVDGVNTGTVHHSQYFQGPHEHRVFSQAGHNLPQERPADWAQAVLDARAMTRV